MTATINLHSGQSDIAMLYPFAPNTASMIFFNPASNRGTVPDNSTNATTNNITVIITANNIEVTCTINIITINSIIKFAKQITIYND